MSLYPPLPISSVSWGQLQRDVGRDKVRLDGELMTTPDVMRLVVALASKITERLSARNSRRVVRRSPSGGGGNGSSVGSPSSATLMTPRDVGGVGRVFGFNSTVSAPSPLSAVVLPHRADGTDSDVTLSSAPPAGSSSSSSTAPSSPSPTSVPQPAPQALPPVEPSVPPPAAGAAAAAAGADAATVPRPVAAHRKTQSTSSSVTAAASESSCGFCRSGVECEVHAVVGRALPRDDDDFDDDGTSGADEDLSTSHSDAAAFGAGAGSGGSLGLEARIMECARSVMLCSSRTVTGGDPFFAAELVRVCDRGRSDG